MARRKRTFTQELRLLLRDLGWQNLQFEISPVPKYTASVMIARTWRIIFLRGHHITYQIQQQFAERLLTVKSGRAPDLPQACQDIKDFIIECEETRFNTIRDSLDA